jgi:hypothetical protein
MLDAHPNVIVAHEFFLFEQLHHDEGLKNRNRLFDELYTNSANSRCRQLNETKKGYSLGMEESWQGRFTNLRVIGDKSGGKAALMYGVNPFKLKQLYMELTNIVRVPIKVLEVIRNPLDMIATQVLFSGSPASNAKVNATSAHKYTNFRVLQRASLRVVKISKSLQVMTHDLGLSPLQVHCEDLIADPVKTISDICRFLSLDCSAEYLQMCADKTFKNVSESRHLVTWDPQTIPSLIRKLRISPLFRKYASSFRMFMGNR